MKSRYHQLMYQLHRWWWERYRFWPEDENYGREVPYDL